MDLKLKGKVALVTGASSGIGREIARALAAEGVKLCITARRRHLLEVLIPEIVAAGGVKPQIVVADLTQAGTPERIARESIATWTRIDILVNSAGGSRQLPIDAAEEKWDEAITLNFTRLRQLTHAVLPSMTSCKWGRIINITGKLEPKGLNAANAAKAAVHAWSKGLSREVGKHGITVNSIVPGRIISGQNRRDVAEGELKDYARDQIPVGRFGEAEELAAMAVFLASPLASYVSGAVIPVDGGLRRYAF